MNAVANIPGAVPYTSTMALTNATLPYALRLADKGWREACRADKGHGQRYVGYCHVGTKSGSHERGILTYYAATEDAWPTKAGAKHAAPTKASRKASTWSTAKSHSKPWPKHGTCPILL